MEFISKNIKQLRKIKDLTQKEVALSVDIPQGQYSRIESGKVIPTVQTLAKIASVFGVGLSELFKESEEVGNLPLLEKVKLLNLLDVDEKDALTKIIDIAIAKKQMKDSLNQILAS